MPGWMIYAIVALVLWGLSGVTQKLATESVSAQYALIWFAAAFPPIAAAILLMQSLDWAIGVRGWSLAVLGGVLNGLGVLTSFAAYGSGGKASLVTPLIALFPVVTVALAVPLLHEQVTGREVWGIVLSIAAALALSYEKPPTSGDISLGESQN